MNVMQRVAIPLIGIFSAHAMAADPPAAEAAPIPSLQSMVKLLDSYVVMQVEYCLRNVPELSTELVMAHATYNQASALGLQLLGARYPVAGEASAVRWGGGGDSKRQEMQLRQIRSRGVAQCPALIGFMHRATGESLARSHAENHESLLRTMPGNQ